MRGMNVDMNIEIPDVGPLSRVRVKLAGKVSANQMLKLQLLSHQLKLIKMCAKLTNLNHCAVPFLSRADVNL